MITGISDPPSTNSPEKQLWSAVLGQMLNDFSTALQRTAYRECESMIRQMRSEHLFWICETCEIHPDRIIRYMKHRLELKKIHRPLPKHLETKRFYD